MTRDALNLRLALDTLWSQLRARGRPNTRLHRRRQPPTSHTDQTLLECPSQLGVVASSSDCASQNPRCAARQHAGGATLSAGVVEFADRWFNENKKSQVDALNTAVPQ